MHKKGGRAPQKPSNTTRLNKYIANAGICSRRDADQLIAAGHITVNGEKVTTLGYQVKGGDVVKYRNKVLKTEKLVYVLLNKPKDFITTTDDPQGRRTVMDLVKSACKEKIYPVGRLDRPSTGLLVITNDGDLAKKLSHPSGGVEKIYNVTIDKPITKSDLESIQKGVKLEDGMAKVVSIALLDKNKKELGITLKMGKNRVIRRIFEHLGYFVTKLDRVKYAHLTKKNLPRGKWRYLSPSEIRSLFAYR